MTTYSLEDLLAKMGTPEVKHKSRIEWHYFDNAHKDLAGFAEVRLEAEGKRLVADQRRTRENYEDDHGSVHAHFEETFQLVAERGADDKFKITRLAFDGAEYIKPSRAVIELALSIFHARALDISILMVEQTFNKQDVVEAAEEENGMPSYGRRAIFSRLDNIPQRANFGMVIPFRPKERRAG